MAVLEPVVVERTSGLRLKLIPAGEFLMGEPWFEDSRPAHRVRIAAPFYLGIFPVTQREWTKAMRSNPSGFKGEDLPVEKVSWDDCQEFVKRLNEGDTGGGYRLPTEAEWEHACRSGTRSIYQHGDDERDLVNYGWFRINSKGQTHPVGQKKPNAWGLYDMVGNVYEWCSDWYDKEYYKDFFGDEIFQAPAGPAAGYERVMRGGSWETEAISCYSGVRGFTLPGTKKSSIGFRLARSTAP
jgi:formylglycine-generating enzyme required for sulfatase activity